MAKINQNFTTYRGNTERIRFTITQSDGVTPMDVTNATLEWVAQPNVFSSAATLSKVSTDGGIEKTTPLSGIVTVVLTSANTASLSPGKMYHELRLITVNGDKKTVAIGEITVRDSAFQ